jgi:hypothetical protein
VRTSVVWFSLFKRTSSLVPDPEVPGSSKNKNPRYALVPNQIQFYLSTHNPKPPNLLFKKYIPEYFFSN